MSRRFAAAAQSCGVVVRRCGCGAGAGPGDDASGCGDIAASSPAISCRPTGTVCTASVSLRRIDASRSTPCSGVSACAVLVHHGCPVGRGVGGRRCRWSPYPPGTQPSNTRRGLGVAEEVVVHRRAGVAGGQDGVVGGLVAVAASVGEDAGRPGPDGNPDVETGGSADSAGALGVWVEPAVANTREVAIAAAPTPQPAMIMAGRRRRIRLVQGRFLGAVRGSIVGSGISVIESALSICPPLPACAALMRAASSECQNSVRAYVAEPPRFALSDQMRSCTRARLKSVGEPKRSAGGSMSGTVGRPG